MNKHFDEMRETNHMVDDEPTTLLLAFEAFRKVYSGSRVVTYDEFMVYRVIHRRFAKTMLTEADNIIKRLRLPLRARVEYSIIDATIIIEEKK